MKSRVAGFWAKQYKTTEERKQLEINIAAARPVLDLIIQAVNEQIASTYSDDADFDSPSWRDRAAANIGARKELMKLKKTLQGTNFN